VELDLLGANLIAISIAKTGHETLCLTDAGVKELVAARERCRRSLSAHDRLAHRLGQHLIAAGRVVWRELSLRARFSNTRTSSEVALGKECNGTLPLAQEGVEHASEPVATHKNAWRVARPDVFSVRNTTVEDYLHPMVHEIKTNRADLLSDLRNTAKRESYKWLCSECFYVFPRDVAKPQEIPEDFGVWAVHGAIEDGEFELLRPARHSPCKLPFAVWLALAKATPMLRDLEVQQDCLSTGHALVDDTSNSLRSIQA